MNDEKMDHLVDSLLIYLPMFYKKITTAKETDLKKSSYNKRTTDHYQILGLLEHYNYLSISEIGKRLLISRPNMTSHIDNLVSEGMVKRIPDNNDRRVIKVEITPEGLNYIKESRKWVNNNIRENLSSMSPDDLLEMYNCLEKIKTKILLIEEDHHDKTRKRTED